MFGKKMEPDTDDRGGPSDRDADDQKGFGKLAYKPKKGRKTPPPPMKKPMGPMS